MKIEHREWIDRYRERSSSLLGQCKEATSEMSEAFPGELTVVRGHVLTPWGKRGHFWLVDNDGEIVDPTAAQFPAIAEYEAWRPGDEVRIGTCMNCGDAIWEGVSSLEDVTEKCICSERCNREMVESMGFP